MPSTHQRQSPTDPPWHLIGGDQIGQLVGKLNQQRTYGIVSLFSTPADVVWIASGFGGIAYYRGAWIEEVAVPRPHFTWFREMLWNSGDAEYLLTQSGGQWRPVPVPFQYCHALKTDSAGVLIAAPQADLWFTSDGIQWNRFPLPWKETFVTDFWVAEPGTLWLQTSNRHELYRYQWQEDHLTTGPLPRKNRKSWDAGILAVCLDQHGGIWASLDGSGLWHWDGIHWDSAPRARDYGQQGILGHVQDLCIDQHGRVWAATTMGLCRQENGIWQPLLVARDEPTQQRTILFGHLGRQSIRHLVLDRAGYLWLGSAYGELLRIDTTKALYTRPMGYPFEMEPFHPIVPRTL